jgi:hypothetical protein
VHQPGPEQTRPHREERRTSACRVQADILDDADSGRRPEDAESVAHGERRVRGRMSFAPHEPIVPMASAGVGYVPMNPA